MADAHAQGGEEKHQPNLPHPPSHPHMASLSPPRFSYKARSISSQQSTRRLLFLSPLLTQRCLLLVLNPSISHPSPHLLSSPRSPSSPSSHALPHVPWWRSWQEMKGRSFQFFSFCEWLFTSSGLEWTGEITPSAVLHIADVILKRALPPPSEPRLDLEAVMWWMFEAVKEVDQ